LFVTYANLDRPPLQGPDDLPARAAPLERWLLSRLQATIAEVRLAFDTYQIRRAVTAVDSFIHDDLSNWYVRRRRRELWKGALDPEKQAAFQVLYHVLVRVCQLLAPVMPFVTEHVYRNLVPPVSPGAPISIHLTGFPQPDPALAQPELEARVEAVRRVLGVGLAARNAARLKVRTPLGRALLAAPPDVEGAVRAFEPDILEELNVERLETVASLDDTLIAESRDVFAVAADRDVMLALDTRMTPDLRRKALARHLVHQIQMMRKDAGLNVDDRIRISVDAHGEVTEAIAQHSPYICAETLAVELRHGSPPEGWVAREADLEGVRVNVALVRAGGARIPGHDPT
jgi:isoleucyl-tRNA synthetase